MTVVLPMLLAGVLLGAPSDQQPEKKPEKYSIDTSKTTKDLQAGESGMFWMHIQPKAGFKVSAEAPLKIDLSADGLKLHKSKLARTDATDKKAEAPEFGVKFAAVEPGTRAIKVDATFFVCDAQICERKKAQLSVPVSVRQ